MKHEIERKYTNIHTTESMQKHYLNYHIKKLRLGGSKSKRKEI